MIKIQDRVFRLETPRTTYILSIDDFGHPENIYYGPKIADGDEAAVRMKNTMVLGSAVDYTEEREGYCLDNVLLDYSGIGKGDYRHSPIELIMPDGSFVCDFVYKEHELFNVPYKSPELPVAHGKGETLKITLADKKYGNLELQLYYTLFEGRDVICRAVELHNKGEGDVYIRKLMSFMLDLPAREYDMITFDGTWAKEMHIHRRPAEEGILVNDSTTGASSNRHNPGYILASRDADYECGTAFGVNLIYSGNHYSAVERSPMGTVRIMSGINPHCFLWKLKSGESFYAPQAVLTFGDKGINSVSENMHAFVNENIVDCPEWAEMRPVVINNWEATFFNFNRRKLHSLAGRAKKLGVEMFVLDDGWFGRRDDDRRGLGDWVVNKKKLPGGIASIARKINKMGMRFGLWFEPECVNPDSDLYRAHPEWIIRVDGREPSQGRHQFVLDLCNPLVRDYIVDAVDMVLSDANISYVKWDYNRHISDPSSGILKNQGEFYHRYILGLYDILRRIFKEKHPEVLLESCSSGGNRFDLGMLCYSPQIWTSDNTDPIERLDIQGGAYCLYPQSAVSSHVSMAPHQQTLRDTPLSTRFNVSAFAPLGYELDFGELTPDENKQIKAQIDFYKAHRKTFQKGRLVQIRGQKNQVCWQIMGEDEIIVGLYRTHTSAVPERDILRVPYADPNKHYRVTRVEQKLRIKRFGSLVKHISPIPIKPDGFILRTVDRHYSLTDAREEYECSGFALRSGIALNMQYEGTGYHPDLRILGDFGSDMYLITEIDKN